MMPIGNRKKRGSFLLPRDITQTQPFRSPFKSMARRSIAEAAVRMHVVQA